LRPDEPAYGIVEDLAESLPGAAQLYPLELLDLEDAAARDGLLSFLNWRVPAARNVPEAQLLASIEGYPGVIYHWTSDYQREAMRSAEDLERVAADAHEYRFHELETLLPPLQGDARRLAARLSLLPLAAASEVWDEIKLQVIDGLDADALDGLRLCRVLENADPPSFGHAKRWDAVRDWFVEKRKNTIRPEAEALVLAFTSRIRDTSADAIVPVVGLIGLRTTSGRLKLSDLHRGLCEAAMALAGQRADSHAILHAARAARTEPRAAPLMAMGLFNTLVDAKAEDDLPRRDALLDELRELTARYPDDESVQEVWRLATEETTGKD
jgi:hypothetical protein